MKRIFLVGCPRSGTTLLQSLLASHSEIVSFPETHLFSKTISINKIVQFFTVYGTQQKYALESIADELCNRSVLMDIPTGPIYSTQQWVAHLLPVLNHIAETQYGTGEQAYLLEKTPRHLHFIEEITQADSDAQFVHVIRSGIDVVASMMEATNQHPEAWSAARDIKKSVFWWNRSIKISREYVGETNHHFIWYNDIINHPDWALEQLLNNLGLQYEPGMIADCGHTASTLISSNEHWKARNLIGNVHRTSKADSLTKEEKNYIRKHLTHFDYSQIAFRK